VDQVEISNKLYFRIGEVAKIVGVKPYVLRYWETEFPILKPGKTPSRHRLYRRRDVETLLDIKRLLYEEGFTIAGAKKRLKDGQRLSDEAPPLSQAEPAVSLPIRPDRQQRKILTAIHRDILSLHKLLSDETR
jgi:DNA-binding transcriptional MerR regulator